MDAAVLLVGFACSAHSGAADVTPHQAMLKVGADLTSARHAAPAGLTWRA